MKKLIIYSFCLLCAFSADAQQNYDVRLIQKDLLSRAAAVVRTKAVEIEVRDLNSVIYHYKIATTVLNKNGDDEAALHLWYNKNTQVKYVRGTVYDEFLNPLVKLQKDFRDVSAMNDFSLFEDSRAKIFRPSVISYPYTVEYEYQVHAKHTMYFPEWYPNTSTDVSVEHSVLRFSSPPDFTIRFSENHYNGASVIIKETDKLRMYTWEVKNLKAARQEPFSLSPAERFTSVRIAPNSFKYIGVEGAFSNWKEMGSWMSEKLLKGRDQVPAGTAAYIKNLTADIDDPKLKARKVYEYVQQKTRYISVQVGIGGFQPATAEHVDMNSYGDCKGLANYTQSLLKVAGIESYYALVYGDNSKRSAIPDFASMDQFNHVILCIPFKNDTLWVDCTSKENPFGYLGTFTDDRLALICTENGGQLIRTPKFTDDKSLQSRKVTFSIDSAGNLTGDILTSFSGSQYDNREHLLNEPFNEQVKKLTSVYPIDNAIIESYQLTQDKSVYPLTSEKLTLSVRNYASENAGLLYVPLNMLNPQRPLPELKNRINTVNINRGYTDIDEIVFTLPGGYKPEAIPQNFTKESPFGYYSSTVRLEGDILTYTRKMVLKSGNYPPEKYADLAAFYQFAADADKQKILLAKIKQ